jgi:sulfite reductase beta subunit-like hemoprotein
MRQCLQARATRVGGHVRGTSGLGMMKLTERSAIQVRGI